MGTTERVVAGGVGLAGVIGLRLVLGLAKLWARSSSHDAAQPSWTPPEGIEARSHRPGRTAPQRRRAPVQVEAFPAPDAASARRSASAEGVVARRGADLAGRWRVAWTQEPDATGELVREPAVDGVYPVELTVSAPTRRSVWEGFEIDGEHQRCRYWTRVTVELDEGAADGALPTSEDLQDDACQPILRRTEDRVSGPGWTEKRALL